jgi:hypothetical protein
VSVSFDGERLKLTRFVVGTCDSDITYASPNQLWSYAHGTALGRLELWSMWGLGLESKLPRGDV